MNSNESTKGAKLGRKGDPRMHRAVAARLENPEISLFDALQIGGFQYPTNDDSSIMDSEKVTLGQRKNQLSRRLRLARKQGSDYGKGDNNNSPLAAGNLKQQQAASGKPAKKSTIAALALQMKRDCPEVGGLSDDEEEEVLENQPKKPRVAKFHPDYAPVFVPRGRNPFQPNSIPQNNPSGNASQNFGNFPSGVNPMNLSFGHPFNAVGSFPQNPYLMGSALNSQQSPQPKASAVAISSLTNSAQRVGLTLEQLAMTLSSSPTILSKIIAGDSDDNSLEKQRKLALNLYGVEVQTLYTKSMLMAGIDGKLCGPETETYLDFALKAWQEEGRRLQELVRNSQPVREPPLAVANDKSSEKGDDVSEGNSDSPNSHTDHHSHSHSHSHHSGEKGDSDSQDSNTRHLHRLDGQCGHKAIIHQPKGGVAHIDFVIGKTIECYHGIERTGNVWPSKYKCKEIDTCSKKCIKATTKTEALPEPKVIPLSDIDLQDPEWNFDISGSSLDGGILGLFKLGETPDELTGI